MKSSSLVLLGTALSILFCGCTLDSVDDAQDVDSVAEAILASPSASPSSAPTVPASMWDDSQYNTPEPMITFAPGYGPPSLGQRCTALLSSDPLTRAHAQAWCFVMLFLKNCHAFFDACMQASTTMGPAAESFAKGCGVAYNVCIDNNLAAW